LRRRHSDVTARQRRFERLRSAHVRVKSSCKPTAVRIEVPEPGVTVSAWDDDSAEWCEVYHYVQYLPVPQPAAASSSQES